METLLDALQAGRLFELPENNKDHALRFLAHIIEAFPEIPAGTDVVGCVVKREAAANTALGKGWACPHARVPFDEDLMAVIGWSPAGIDYAAADGQPVHLVVMHIVPDNQRNHYLREMAQLAKSLMSYPGIERLQQAKDLDEVRNYLLDLIAAGKETAAADARARMIRLQARPAPGEAALRDLSALVVEPVTIVSGPGMKHVVLAQNPRLVDALDAASGLAEKLESDGVFQNGGWRVLRRASVSYQGGRIVFDCLAIKLNPPASG